MPGVFKTMADYNVYMAEHDAKMHPQAQVEGEDIPDVGRESKLQGRILKWAKDNGFPCWHDRSRGKNEPGWPDCILFLKKRVVLIELKAAKGVLSDDQKLLRLQFVFLGHEYHKVRSYKRFLEIMNGAPTTNMLKRMNITKAGKLNLSYEIGSKA